MRKDLRALKKLAKRFNRRIERRKKHYCLVCTDGKLRDVICSCTPSDVRALKNIRAELRRVRDGRDYTDV